MGWAGGGQKDRDGEAIGLNPIYLKYHFSNLSEEEQSLPGDGGTSTLSLAPKRLRELFQAGPDPAVQPSTYGRKRMRNNCGLLFVSFNPEVIRLTLPGE